MESNRDMPKTYEFAGAEERLYQWWESNGWFKPEVAGEDARPYVISIPPPNVTGALHQGHALFVAVEDMMIRHARMNGYAALWVPGSDHAGIATQLQVEKLLLSEGTSRQAVGRDEFLRRTWEWKATYGGRITQQLRRLGASCDWDRERFTLDEGLSRAVREAFVRWYEEGKIYQDTRLINWSPNLQTAVSDLEVERVEQPGFLYYFKYRLVDSDEFIPVATTRPETILGDTAVAVHPDDERYQQFIGSTVEVPILKRHIPVIADQYVDRAFGTGALKITPGHDPNDYEIGKKYDLPVISILNKDATLNDQAGPYQGLDRFIAREQIWSDMAEADLVIKKEPYTHIVPVAQRGGELIEPMISTQWFVDVSEPAQRALKAVETGELTIVPDYFSKVWEHWLTNIQPWCISRQLWWGHRIPAWHCLDCGEVTVSREDPSSCSACHSVNIEQDPDVLDTWFSSGLWPFSTLGWPDQTPDLRRYYPTTMMETGYDILFFWVARMVMMGLSFTDQLPFRTIYLHGLVRDANGKKMSKSYGNVIDPIEVMDEYGTDALRFTLLTGSAPGSDMNLSIDRIASNRNFANKIWNAARFIVTNLTEGDKLPEITHSGLSLPDRWILSRLNHLINNTDRLFENYQYGEAGRQVYEFLWGEVADWYIEISKIHLYSDDSDARLRTLSILVHVMDTCLRLLHPFIPFVTEEIWSHLPHDGEALIIARWPRCDESRYDDDAERFMEKFMELIKGIRNARAEYDVPPSRKISAVIESSLHKELEGLRFLFARLANIDAEQMLIKREVSDPPKQAAVIATGGTTAYLPLAGLIDIKVEVARLEKELNNLIGFSQRIHEKLNNEKFIANAPADIVEKERERLDDLRTQIESIKSRLGSLS